MAKKVMVVALFAYFLLISGCMGAEMQPATVCCTNPYSGCIKGNASFELRCYEYCNDLGCKGGECKNWGHPEGQCHCYC